MRERIKGPLLQVYKLIEAMQEESNDKATDDSNNQWWEGYDTALWDVYNNIKEKSKEWDNLEEAI